MATAKANWLHCFNHRVVTLVADKPKGHICVMYFADYIRQLARLPRLSYNEDLAVSNH